MTLHIEVKLRKLTPLDRCDRCGVRGQVLVKTPAGELVFCGHHAADHAAEIIRRGYPTNSEQEDEGVSQ